jgi:methionyl-tRNA formyltransferase
MGQLAAALQQINARLDSQAQQQTQQTRAATRATLPAEIEEEGTAQQLQAGFAAPEPWQPLTTFVRFGTRQKFAHVGFSHDEDAAVQLSLVQPG